MTKIIIKVDFFVKGVRSITHSRIDGLKILAVRLIATGVDTTKLIKLCYNKHNLSEEQINFFHKILLSSSIPFVVGPQNPMNKYLIV